VRVINTDFAREMNRQTGGMVVALRRAANNRDEAHRLGSRDEAHRLGSRGEAHRLGSRGEATGALLVGLTIRWIVRHHPTRCRGHAVGTDQSWL
jgi:hypothetical protein